MQKTQHIDYSHNLSMALHYAKVMNWPVFPMHHPVGNGCSCGKDKCKVGKHPMVKDWPNIATTDEYQIMQWWNNWPDANIGIPTGADTFYVLDIDVADGKLGLESLEKLELKHGKLPETLTATSGSGGKHYFFEYSGPELRNQTDILPGLDFRGDGGCIIVEPSLHHSGGTYRWDNLEEQELYEIIDELPDWLEKLVLKPKKEALKASAGTILDGTRNDSLFRFGCSLREKGTDEAELLTALEGKNKTLSEPLDQAEIEEIVTSICEHYPAGKVPESNLSEYLDELFEGYKQKDRNELIGLPLKKFSQLAKHIDGVQDGFYLIPGEAGAGKTMYLINLFLDVIDTNEVSGFYFSLDDPRKTILNRMLACLSGVSINDLQKLKGNPNGQQLVIQAKGRLQSFIKQNRLNLFDISQVQHINQIKRLAEQAKERGNKFFIAIDGTYNLRVGKYANARDENIQRANKLKEIADVFEIPVICTGEVRKSDGKYKGGRELSNNDIMESGKYIYNPNLITILTRVYDDKLKQYTGPIQLYCSKNKLSSFNGKLILDINKDNCQVTENTGKF
jgi:replicative DNA helicase